MNAIDLFAGSGGFSTGATLAGCKVLWAANHWQDAVHWHTVNHPETKHVCQDLHQANWDDVPQHDLLLASPCCQGHSKARGKAMNNPQHDASRSTAWAVVSALEFHQPPVGVIENVPEFLLWELYPAWEMAIQRLGYSISVNIIDAADHGAPQHRVRMFLVITKSKTPLRLDIEKEPLIPANSFIDFAKGNWQPINKKGRAQATLERVANGRKAFGDRFLISYYGNTRIGRSLERPVGTITTRDRWAVIDGDRMRMFSRFECRAAMSFPDDYKLPENHRLAVHLMGNAVCPEPVRRIIAAVMEAA